MITTTREYDIFWRDVGQFLGPAATADPEQLEKLKEFGSHLHAELAMDRDAAFKILESDDTMETKLHEIAGLIGYV